MVNEMTAVGGLILIGLSLMLLDLKKPRVANYLPALITAPLLVAVGGRWGSISILLIELLKIMSAKPHPWPLRKRRGKRAGVKG